MAENETPTESKRSKKIIISAMLITAIVFFLFGRSCSTEKHSTMFIKPNEKNKPVLIHSDTVTQYIKQPHWQTITNTVVRVDSFFVPVPAKIDTLAILKNYFTRYAYTDTTKDSNIVIVNKYWVTQNKIIGDSLHTSYKLLREKVITNTYIAPNKIYLSVGMQFGISRTGYLLSPEILLTDRKRRSYGLGYDVINQMYLGKIYIPLKFK